MKLLYRQKKIKDKGKKKNGQDNKLKKKLPVQQKKTDVEERKRKHGNDNKWRKRRKREDDKSKKNHEGGKQNVGRRYKKRHVNESLTRRREQLALPFLPHHRFQHLPHRRSRQDATKFPLHLHHPIGRQRIAHYHQIKLSTPYPFQAIDLYLTAPSKLKTQEVSIDDHEITPCM
jgi:hypothetical protein